MDTQEQLNLEKLKDLIKNGINAIPKDESASEAIIVVGDTGVGKSTILNFLAGNKLVVKSQGLKPKLLTVGASVIKIGHDKYSQTSIPTRIYIHQFAFYDCPGFRDNKGEQYEIANSFFVQKLLDIYQKVKIVLLIDESHISQARADKLPRLTKNLLRSFKSFNDIKQGVILIINRADPDLKLIDYCKQIRKMSGLKNEKGFLFGEQEQAFLRYLIDHNRIKLFQQPQKKDNNVQYFGTELEKDILPSIKRSDFVKSKHILNIVSESAKIAIRDYIDDITIKSNVKVEKVSIQITNKVQQKVNLAARNVSLLLEVKEQIMHLAEEIRNQNGFNVLSLLKRQLPDYDMRDFEDDFESILFFKGIYDKTDTYFSNLINKTYSQLAIVLHKLDTRIIRYQKEQLDELQRKQQMLKRQEIKNQRDREKLETMKKITQMHEMRNKIGEQQKAKLNFSIIKQVGDTLNKVTHLQNEFVSLKADANRLQIINHELNHEFKNFSVTRLKSPV